MFRHPLLFAVLLVPLGCQVADRPTSPAGAAGELEAARFGRPDVVVGPGESIQEAVDAASPGAVIHIEPGLYLEAVIVDKPGIKLVGRTDRLTGEGVVIENPGAEEDGIFVRPDGDGFALLNVTVRGFEENGVFLVRVHGFLLSRVTAENNGEYGLFPVRSSGGVIEFSSASGHSDTGIYVGQSEDVRMRGNVAFGNVNGFTVENSSAIQMIANESFDNTAGIIVTLLPGHDVTASSGLLIAGNHVHDNDRPNFAEPGDIAAAVPAGSGILVVGTDRTIVEGNTVTGNDFVGIGVGSTLVLGALAGIPPEEILAEIEPDPDGARVRDNLVTGNGAAPPPLPIPLPGVDLLWDGAGTDNCWEGNTFDTSFPSPLPPCE